MEKIPNEKKLTDKRKDDGVYSSSGHDLHLLIYQLCENELLKEILEGLRNKALLLTFKLSTLFTEFLAFHKNTFEAFRKHELKAAEKATQRHNRRKMEIIRATS